MARAGDKQLHTSKSDRSADRSFAQTDETQSHTTDERRITTCLHGARAERAHAATSIIPPHVNVTAD